MEHETDVEATLLPAGTSRRAEPHAVLSPDDRPGPRRFLRWDVLLAVALAAVALVVTVIAVNGLGTATPPPKEAAATNGKPGSDVVVSRDGTGSGTDALRIRERLVLPAPVRAVELARPELDTTGMRLPQPILTDLTARDDRGDLEIASTATGWTIAAADGAELTAITVEYRAGNAIIPEPQAPVAGRALLVVTPVTAVAARDASVPVIVRAPGIAVRQAVCATSPTTQQLCGVEGGPPGTAELTGWQGVAVVVLQADLR